MKFEYKLIEIGWAEVSLEINEQRFYCHASYISEPLIDLLEGLLSIIPGCVPDDELKTSATFKWQLEPAIGKWTLMLVDTNILKIEIETYEDNTCIKKLRDFKATCNLLDFINEIIISLEQLLKDHGLVGYKNFWYSYDFPISSFLKLKYYLYNKKSYPTVELKNIYDSEYPKSNIEEELNFLLSDPSK